METAPYCKLTLISSLKLRALCASVVNFLLLPPLSPSMPTAELFAIFPDLRGRAALVTGAGRAVGIGAAICRALADQGCNVFFTYYSGGVPRDPAEAPEGDYAVTLLGDLRARGVRSECIDVDLGAARSAETVLDRACEAFGALSILVNNAAHGTRDGFESLDREGLDAHYFVNVRATVLLSVGFAKRFSDGAGGRIINLTSGQDLRPMPGELAYVASKGAISAFTRTLAKELAHKRITVNAIDPGPTDTGWMSMELKARLAAENGLGRVGYPEDAARLVVFLASSAGEWISGEVIHSRGNLD
jgi:3-oxoacyl-[acyl-carrier protein] reductase